MKVIANKNDVSVSASLGDINYLTEISGNGNVLISDEPEFLGGENKGFNPFELLASSLAACTAATLRMYATRKEWNIGEIKVEVNLTNDTTNKKASLEKNISFGNKDLDEATLERLKKIAEACPVNRLLQNEIEIVSKLA